MIRFKILVIFIILYAVSNSAQWFELDAGTDEKLNSVFFLDENQGWVAGKDVILKTTDSGNNWLQIQLTGTNNSIHFIDNNLGWVCNSEGNIFKTTDGGINWVLKHTEAGKEITSIAFENENIGIASGYFRTVLVTKDGGESWKNVLAEGYDHLLKTYIYSANQMFVIGGNGLVYRSADNGKNWDSLNVGMPNAFYGISFISPTTGFAFGCCGAYFKTTDGGNTWQNHNYITTGDIIYSSDFVDENIGWVVGELGWLLKTTDGGESWFDNGPDIDEEFRSVFFVNKEIGFVSGSNGTILKTVNGGGSSTSISDNGESNKMVFQLRQNYPNPFNPTTSIQYAIGSQQFVSLKVYDVLGNEVATLVDEFQPAGSYEVEFSTKGGSASPQDVLSFSSGIYYYQLITDTFSETKKMILMK
jgi:photosystem II stability/assembly factor-like uncharacterized protein